MKMNGPQVFLSYSRQDIYFAEAVALWLQQAGVRTWFDLQQLEPGCDWEQEIERGLTTCDALVLVASRGAAESPYVDSECQHALADGKPVYVHVFEAIPDAPVVVEHDGEPRSLHLRRIIDQAAVVIDGRARFADAMRRLTAAVRAQPVTSDPIPAPHPWGLPTRLPLAVGFVALAMALLTALTGLATLQALNIHLLLALGCGLVTGWLANRTWAFLQRESYRDTRLALLGGALWSALYVGWLLPIVLAGLLLAMASPDIHRYSPLTQGLRQKTRYLPTSARRRQATGFGERLAVFYGRLMGLLKALIVVVSGIVLVLSVVGLFSTLSRNARTAPTTEGLAVILLIIGVSATLFVSHFVLNRRYKRLLEDGLGKAGVSGLTYAVVVDALDENIAAHVEEAMTNAGHRARTSTLGPKISAADADFVIVILTDNLSAYAMDSIVDPLLQSRKRLIFIIAAALSDPERFRKYSHYQWVDYRRQMPGSLDAMAEDILIFGADIVSHSFSTRQTPQSFDRPILPLRVASYVGFQYFAVNVSVFLIVLSLFGGLPYVNPLFYALFAALTLILSIWVINRVIKREITIESILGINLGIAVVSNIVSIVMSLSSVPAGMRVDGGRVFQYIVGVVIGMIIGYILGRGILRGWLGGWLPNYVPFSVPFPGFRRDWALWRRNLLAAGVVAVFTVILLAPSLGSLSERRGALPIQQLLEQGNSPIVAFVGGSR